MSAFAENGRSPEDLRAALEAVAAERDRLVRELVFLRSGQIVAGDTEHDRIMRTAANDRREIDRLRADMAEMLELSRTLRAHVDAANARVRALENSRSWRLTAPLRGLHALLRGRRRVRPA